MDPSAPVIVGVAQLSGGPASPLGLMAAAAREALGTTGLRVDSVGVTDCLTWRVPDPARVLAAELGLSPRTTVYTHTSGTSPLDLLADACSRISAGEQEVALLAGAEAVKALKTGRYTGGPAQPADVEPTRKLGTDRVANHPAEQAAGLFQPVHFYAMFENAIRTAAGRSPAAHDEHLRELSARFATVAEANPYAWGVGGGNRMVSSPYRKLMTANIHVDQAAAVVVCSARAAEAAGVPRSDWVYVHATAAAHDHWFVGERDRLDRSPALHAVGHAVLDHAGVTIDDIGPLDLYSCFPSAVQVAASELGVDLSVRTPTVTGGLTFAGGPGSNYVMHALAETVRQLRDDPAAVGLCTAVGWYLTKHAAVVLSATPPQQPYRALSVQSEVDALPRREIVVDFSGPAVIETYTVSYDRDEQPATGYVACLLPDGRRAFASAEAAGWLASGDPIGREIRLDGGKVPLEPFVPELPDGPGPAQHATVVRVFEEGVQPPRQSSGEREP